MIYTSEGANVEVLSNRDIARNLMLTKGVLCTNHEFEDVDHIYCTKGDEKCFLADQHICRPASSYATIKEYQDNVHRLKYTAACNYDMELTLEVLL